MMRTEAQIRQCIGWLSEAQAGYDPTNPEDCIIAGAIQGQIDILHWALGEPNRWDDIYNKMAERHGAVGNN